MYLLKEVCMVVWFAILKVSKGEEFALCKMWKYVSGKDSGFEIVRKGGTNATSIQNPHMVTDVKTRVVRVYMEMLHVYFNDNDCSSINWADLMYGLVRHEYRHTKQIEYLEVIDPELPQWAFSVYDKLYPYRFAPSERDAYGYMQVDYKVPIAEAMEPYVKAWKEFH